MGAGAKFFLGIELERANILQQKFHLQSRPFSGGSSHQYIDLYQDINASEYMSRGSQQ